MTASARNWIAELIDDRGSAPGRRVATAIRKVAAARQPAATA